MEADEQLDMLTEGIRRGSHLLLDNVGIHVRMSDTPSWALREALHRVMFGRGRLERFWCLSVRPWLMPRWQAQVEAAWERAGDLTRAELLAATLEQASAMRDRLVEKQGQPEE